jgi:hypothetical protein
MRDPLPLPLPLLLTPSHHSAHTDAGGSSDQKAVRQADLYLLRHLMECVSVVRCGAVRVWCGASVVCGTCWGSGTHAHANAKSASSPLPLVNLPSLARHPIVLPRPCRGQGGCERRWDSDAAHAAARYGALPSLAPPSN